MTSVIRSLYPLEGQTMNNSYSNQSHPSLRNTMDPIFVYPICSLHILVILAAIAGNLFVFATIMFTKGLRNSATNIFILSLSISDLLTAVVTVPFEVDILLQNGQWTHGELMCNAWTTLYLIVIPTSILTLLAVSIDRYKTLSDPLNKYRESRFMTRKRAMLIVLALWTYSILLALIPRMGWRVAQESVSYGRCNFNITYIYSIVSSAVNFIIPLIITSIIYLKIYQIAKKDVIDIGTNRTSSLVPPSDSCNDHKHLMKNLRAAKTISIIVCGFFLCWFPYTLCSVVGAFCFSCAMDTPQSLLTVLLLLGYTNSALNPYLYSFRNRTFRNFSMKLLTRVSRKSHSTASRSNCGTDLIAYDVHPQRAYLVTLNQQALTS